MNVAKRRGKPFAEFFFAEVRQIALSSIAGAMVIGIAILLEFRRYRAVVIGTIKQTGKSEFAFAVFRLIALAKHRLYLLEEYRADSP